MGGFSVVLWRDTLSMIDGVAHLARNVPAGAQGRPEASGRPVIPRQLAGGSRAAGGNGMDRAGA